jgi:hypothetical protein
MSFRQFGGINYAPKHNIVGSNYNTSNNLIVTQNIGQANSYINFRSDISGNIYLDGDLDVSGNLRVDEDLDVSGNITGYNMFLSSWPDNYSFANNALMPKSYIDLISGGLNYVGRVTVISDPSSYGYTAPVPISPSTVSLPYSIDGFQLSFGQQVLLNDQIDPSYNGIYIFNTDGGSGGIFTRSTTILPLGYNAKAALVNIANGEIFARTGWLQSYVNPNSGEAIVGLDPLVFTDYFNLNFKIGQGLNLSIINNQTYLNVDSSLNYLVEISNPGESLNIGTTDTTLLFKNNEYNVTPYSIGPTLSPPIVNITSNTSSIDVSFNWTIPTPSNSSIPTSLQTLNAVLYYTITGGIVKSYNIPNITPVSSINSITVSSFSGSSTSSNFYVQIGDFSSLIESSSNQLILWYSNYGPYPNVSYVGYSSFVSSGPPSAVYFNNLTQPNNNFNQLTVPVSVAYTDDDNKVTGPPYIDSYQVFYNTSGSSRRYPQGLSSSESQTFSINPPTSANSFSSLLLTNGPIFPDCVYDISANAQNNQNLNYGPLGNYLNGNGYQTELPTYPSTTQPTPLFTSVPNYNNNNATGGYFLASDINGNNNVKSNPGIVNKNFTFPTSNAIITPVQQTGIVGNQSLSSSITVTGTINSSSSSINVGSFSTSNNGTNTSNSITITYNTYDAYTNNYNQGFYLDCSSNMNINTYIQNLNYPTNSLYLATLSVTGNDVDPSANYSFYIDSINSNPSYFSIISYSINSNNNYYSSQVSGIWVLSSNNPVFTISGLQLLNMGTYFYASPLVTYNFTNGVTGTVSETNLNNVTNKNNPLPNPISITNTNVSTTISGSYKQSIGFNISFNNLYGPGSQTFSPLSVIVDVPSYNLANSIINLNSVGQNNLGYRVWSAPSDYYQTMNPSGIVPFVFIPSGQSTPNGIENSNIGYVDVSYNNTWDISGNYANQEMLIANGNFTTNNSYYLNYSSYNGNGNQNTVNYNNLSTSGPSNSGIKFATFAWNATTSTSYSYINFKINFTNTLYSNPQNNNFYYFDNNFSNQLLLFYRFEYETGITSSSWGQISGSANYYPNTTWISINSVTFGSTANINTASICNYNNVDKVFWNTVPQTTVSGYNYTFKTSLPAVLLSSSAVLYLRIGIPNNIATGFNNVYAYLSTN